MATGAHAKYDAAQDPSEVNPARKVPGAPECRLYDITLEFAAT